MHSYPTGLSYSLDVTIRGLRLVLGGYNDKLPAFAAEVRLIKALTCYVRRVYHLQ